MSVNSKEEILKLLEDYPFGLTISEISEKSGFHRNTVSKYLSILEAENSVNKKEIGMARVYFTTKRKYLMKNLVVSFLQSLLKGLKDELSISELKLKRIGRIISNQFEFPIGNTYINQFKKAKIDPNPINKLKLFQLFYNSYNIFEDDLEISIIELNSEEIVYRIKNSDFLDSNSNYSYFFHIACGITEGIYNQNMGLDLKCRVKDIHLSKSKDKSFVDISLELI